jgi:hypothetical protein
LLIINGLVIDNLLPTTNLILQTYDFIKKVIRWRYQKELNRWEQKMLL